jgi:hypothetical protein
MVTTHGEPMAREGTGYVFEQTPEDLPQLMTGADDVRRIKWPPASGSGLIADHGPWSVRQNADSAP